jgi:hypothetical protein
MWEGSLIRIRGTIDGRGVVLLTIGDRFSAGEPSYPP